MSWVYTLSIWFFLTVKNGFDVNPFQNDSKYYSQITNVVENVMNSGDVKSLSFLLDHGLNVNYQTKAGYSLLHLAVLSDKIELEKELINRGAQLYLQSHDGETPLACAFRKGNIESVIILLNATILGP